MPAYQVHQGSKDVDEMMEEFQKLKDESIFLSQEEFNKKIEKFLKYGHAQQESLSRYQGSNGHNLVDEEQEPVLQKKAVPVSAAQATTPVHEIGQYEARHPNAASLLTTSTTNDSRQQIDSFKGCEVKKDFDEDSDDDTLPDTESELELESKSESEGEWVFDSSQEALYTFDSGPVYDSYVPAPAYDSLYILDSEPDYVSLYLLDQ
ncbi:hypothetical protein NHQ30_002049 [Ciborinia camelliae]|nr:hypothetical protein NHQ30_002049 [Ciborinia camelliae]